MNADISETVKDKELGLEISIPYCSMHLY